MNIKLTTEHFIEITKRGYSLDIIFLLRMIQEGNDLTPLLKSSERIVALHSSVVRKGLVIESGDKLTILGQELLVYMDTKQPEKLAKRKIMTTEFDAFWSAFPSTDYFTYKGKTFTGCRSLRQNKEMCNAKFQAILLEGEYSATQIIEALKYDVQSKKEVSLKTGTNKLTYLQNSATYLTQRSYSAFIDLINQGFKIKEESSIPNGTDI